MRVENYFGSGANEAEGLQKEEKEIKVPARRRLGFSKK